MDNPPDDGPCEVTITAPDHEWLHSFVRQLVEDRLAAAAHVDMMRTTYRWDGSIHEAAEARAVLHSRSSSVPCVAVTSIVAGDADYLGWILRETS